MKSILILSLLAMSLLVETTTTTDTTSSATDASKDGTTDAEPVLPKVCNPILLATFKLNRSSVDETLPNLVCPSVTSNCCSYAAQHQIVRLWSKGSERSTIVNTYRAFVDIIKDIFKTFTMIEPMAQTIVDATADQLENPCNSLAKAVVSAKFSALKDEIIKITKRNFNFLYDSRKGFYCSLCDKKVHHLYQADGEMVSLSYGFCNDMVTNSLPFYLFKHIHFMKMARLYGELMSKCTIEGEYRPNEYLAHQAIFVKEPDYIEDVTTCKDNLAKVDAFNYCAKFCERFNPVRFNPLLEGELNKIASFNKILKKLANSKIGIVKVSNKGTLLSVTENSKRLLSERNLSERSKMVKRRGSRRLQTTSTATTTAPTAPAKTSTTSTTATGTQKTATTTTTATATKGIESKVEINIFNKENETALVRPITYDFANEIATKFRVSFDYSYIQSSHNTKYNISQWNTKIQREGINFYSYGKSTDMTKATAAKVFIESNPKLQEPVKKTNTTNTTDTPSTNTTSTDTTTSATEASTTTTTTSSTSTTTKTTS